MDGGLWLGPTGSGSVAPVGERGESYSKALGHDHGLDEPPQHPGGGGGGGHPMVIT